MIVCLVYFFVSCIFAWLACIGLVVRMTPKPSNLIGFFHPYCNQFGGRERVLWSIIRSLHANNPNLRFAIYTGVTEAGERILSEVRDMFGIDLKGIDIIFIRLKLVRYIDSSGCQYFTMVRQFIGSFVLCYEAVLALPVPLFFDTHGHAFGYWFVRGICGIPVMAYIHCPAMGNEMIFGHRDLRLSCYEESPVASNESVSLIKVLYYYSLLLIYQCMGLFVRLAICNSTWTALQMKSIWSAEIKLAYPPCDVTTFKKLRNRELNNHIAISIGQFRGKKDHNLQIEAFARMLSLHPEFSTAKLVLVGFCRTNEDVNRVEALRSKAMALHISENVDFKLNLNFHEMLSLVESAQVGLHTMPNEPFGISVVEFMAAGLVTIAHNSGGPKADIITPSKNGFFASSIEEYSELIALTFKNFEELGHLRTEAQESVDRFSDEEFERRIQEVMQ